MYELTVERRFSAAHHLRNYEGPCARMHGHNYRVEITVCGEALDEKGMLVDFGPLKALCDEVLDELDHRCLNEVAAFATTNVTAENLAAHIFREVGSRLAPGLQMGSVRLWETDGSSVTYREGARCGL